AVSIIQAVAMIAMIVVSVLANGVVCHCIIKTHSLHTITNSFIFNLAATDFCLSALCMPFALVSCITKQWVFGKTVCVVSGFLLSMLCIASILTLVLVAIDRFMAIKYPLKYTLYVTHRACAFMLAYVWFQAAACALLPALGWGSGYVFVEQESICRPEFGTPSKDNGFTSFLFVSSFVIPFSILISIYLSILWTARKQFRQVHHAKIHLENAGTTDNNTAAMDEITSATNTTRGKKMDRASRRRYRARGFKMVLMIVAVFLVCWSPHFILIFYGSLYQIQFPAAVKAVTTWLTFLNSSFNPFLYGFFNARFRSSLKRVFGDKLLCCRWRHQDD
ncbi:predicted protein, partial [Nematostella vectensis]